MELKHALPALCLIALLTACGSTENTAAETPEAESSVAAAMDEATELAADWDPIGASDYDLPGKETEHFSKDQVDSIAGVVIGLLQNQLKYEQAESQEEVLENVDEFTAAAPGLLSDDMEKWAKKDAKDTKKVIWPIAFVQPIDATYTISDASRATYSWDVEERDMYDTDGVEVTMFHRSLYKVQSSGGDENFLVVGRWVALSTIDPDYAAESGNYAWRLNSAIRGVEVCDAVNRSLLVPSSDRVDDYSFKALMKVGPDDFAPKSDFAEDEKELKKEAAKC